MICKDCGIKIYKDSIRCRSCEAKRRIRIGLLSKKGRKFSEKTKKLMSISKQGINHPSYKDGRCLKKYYCKDCKKEISIYSGLYGKGYCRNCMEKGERSHNFKDGTGNFPYPKEFNNKLRESIRNRDNNKCIICSITKKEHYKKYHRNLEVHHINHNKNNCHESNLETRCKVCNIGDNKNAK